MSLSTWLFGKKKSTNSVPVTVETVGEESDDYVIIEKKGQTPQYPVITPNNMYPNLPYSIGPGPAPIYPPQGNHNLRHQESRDSESNMLAGVPFKISSELLMDNAQEFGEISARVNDVLTKASQLEKNPAAYNFSIENNVAKQEGF